MSEHTTGPWTLLEAGDQIKHLVPVSTSTMTSILTIVTEGDTAFGAVYSAEDARRIVACVNACRGLSTDELEQHGLVPAVGSELAELERQRDEMLNAITGMTAMLKNHEWADLLSTIPEVADLDVAITDLVNCRQRMKEQRDELNNQLKSALDSLNDKIVTMRAAYIDAKHNGPAAGMQWIANTLWGPGLIPDESAPWANNAQHYYSHHCSNPLGPCGVCGAPSSVAGNGHVACSLEHHKQLTTGGHDNADAKGGEA